LTNAKRTLRAVMLAIVATIASIGCNAILGITEDPVVKNVNASCVLNSDCTGNLICLFRVCSQPCAADRDCNQANGERCLKTAEGTACVHDAVTSCTGAEPACPGGTSCAGGKCFADCDGRPASCLTDQICESDNVCRGRAVTDASVPNTDGSRADGAAGSPPDAGSTLDAGEGGSRPPECTPEKATRCEGNAQSARSVCKGGVWTTTDACVDGQLCDTVGTPAGQCAVVDARCFGHKPGDSFCDGATRIVCGVDLTSAEATTCDSAQLCAAATSGCATCLDNEFTCDGTQLKKCKADHSGFELSKTCDGTAPCNAQAGDCTTDACSVNQKRCNGDKLEQCNATRSAFTVLATCGAGLCDSAALECDKCVAKSATCVTGKVRTCSDDGQTQADTACPAAKPFCTGAGTCVACKDASDCTAPSDCTGKTCNAGVCGFPPLGGNVACAGGVCDGSGSCVECLSAAQCTAKSDCYTHACGTDHKCAYTLKNANDTCAGGFCDGAGTCKGCLNNTQCTGNKPICASGACAACTADVQCIGKAIGLDHCRTAVGACVACLSSAQCGAPTASICDPTSFSCRACAQASPPTAGDAECQARNGNAAPACKSGGDCGACTATNTSACAGGTPLCNTATNTCVGCLSSADCGGAAPICINNSCAGCTSSSQCAAKGTGQNSCKTTTGACVSCVVDADCGGGNVCLSSNSCCAPESASATCGASNCGTGFNNCGKLISCGSCGNGHCCALNLTPNVFKCQSLQCD
jgi:hypothetical protein